MSVYGKHSQLRLAVDGSTMAPDYSIERKSSGGAIATLAVIDGKKHKQILSIEKSVDRIWSTEAMTWDALCDLKARLPGIAPDLIEIVDENAGGDVEGRIMKTLFLLMAQYDGRAIIPVEWVCRDFFSHLTVAHFLKKTTRGEIKLPVIYIEPSQKAAKGIHVQDLAEYIDAR